MIRTFLSIAMVSDGGYYYTYILAINLCFFFLFVCEKYKPHSSRSNVCFARKQQAEEKKKISSYQIQINHFSLDRGVCDC